MIDPVQTKTFNYAEIPDATDTAGLHIVDFDSDLDTINNDPLADNSIDDNWFEGIDLDGDGFVDEDDHDVAEITSCIELTCYNRVNISLDGNCEYKLSAKDIFKNFPVPIEFMELAIVDEYGNVPIPI